MGWRCGFTLFRVILVFTGGLAGGIAGVIGLGVGTKQGVDLEVMDCVFNKVPAGWIIREVLGWGGRCRGVL